MCWAETARACTQVVFAPGDNPELEVQGVAEALAAAEAAAAAAAGSDGLSGDSLSPRGVSAARRGSISIAPSGGRRGSVVTAGQPRGSSVRVSSGQSNAAAGAISPRPVASEAGATASKKKIAPAGKSHMSKTERSRRRSSVVFNGARLPDLTHAAGTTQSNSKGELVTGAAYASIPAGSGSKTDVKAIFRDLLKPNHGSGKHNLSVKSDASNEPEHHHHAEPLMVKEERQGKTNVRQMRTLLSPDDDGDSVSASQPPSQPGSFRSQPPSQPNSAIN
eukprot:856276-Rhodomonas_salina.1